MSQVAPPCPTSCLRSTAGQPVPLLGVAVTGGVYGAHARIVVRQRYRNDEARPIEAVYTFPVPSDAVLVGFAMECEGRRLEGHVQEREEAFRAYDEALAKGHGAALLEEERHNVFTANVGNLLPGEETLVEVTYVQRLSADEGSLRLMIPTLVAPRYIPGTKQGDRTGHGAADPTDRVPDADRISPRIGDVHYGLALDLLFDLGRDVGIESPSHGIEVTDEGDGKKRVRFRRREVPLDRDVVLLATGAVGPAAGVVADRPRPGEDGTFALTVVPDLFDPSRRAGSHDVVFVVDVSGSMAGASIEQARSALRLCLRHLAEGDRFDVIAFSHQFERFASRGLAPFTQRTLDEADRWVARLEASGGTEMLEPLLAAVGSFERAERDRLVVLLTDGQVGNEAEIVSAVAAKAKKSVRIYTFGIGTNVSDLLLRDLARRTGGDAELIHPGERIDEKVTAQFARATAARVEDVTLRFEGVDVGELAPSTPPALVDGEPWVIYGRYERAGIGHVDLRGSLRGEPFHLRVPIELPEKATREGLAALWASVRIRELEDAEAGLDGRRREANRKRIVDLSVRHGIASKYASFLVVEHRSGDRRAHGQPETRPVPVHGPAGWEMFEKAGPPDFARAAMIGAHPVSGGAMIPMPPPPPASMAASLPPPMSPAPVGAKRPAMGAMLKDAARRLFGGGAPPADRASHPAGPMAYDEADDLAASMDDAEPFEREAITGSMAAHPASGNEEGVAGAAAHATGSPQAIFERQLADGLWPAEGDAAKLLATAKALAAVHAAGIDAAHPIFGAQIKKAIDAICRAAASLAPSPETERAVIAALAAALLVATGRRQRDQVLGVVRSSGSSGVRDLESAIQGGAAAHETLRAIASGG